MTNLKKIIFFSFVLAVSVLLSGCTVSFGSAGGKAIDGGVWKSEDGGAKWVQVVNVPTATGKPATIANVDVRRIIIDPQDHQTVYLATENNGVIYSYDGGVSWRQFRDFRTGRVRSLAVDPKFKCTLYLLAESELWKSNDCGRFWSRIYYHQNQQVTLNDITINPGNNNVLFVGTSAGEVIKSIDGGQSWVTVYRDDKVKASVADVLIDPKSNEVVYVATTKKGIFKSTDGGASWESLGDGLKSYTGSHEYKSLIVDQATPDSLILISKYGMLRTRDGGVTWEIVNLLPASKSTTIFAVAVNPKDSKEVYYATRTSLVKSIDGGQTWSSQKLPFSRSVSRIAIDPVSPQTIYLGSFLIKD